MLKCRQKKKKMKANSLILCFETRFDSFNLNNVQAVLYVMMLQIDF